MTMNSSLDVFFHMRNHYRRLRKVKSVTDSNCPSGKGRNCKSSYSSVNSEHSGRARARSSSGTRPPTRRNPKDMPQEKSKSLGRSEEKPSDVTDAQEYTGAKQSQSQQQHEYLQFSLRITEDIIKNDLYSNDQMKQVLASHFHANKGRLDSSKMIAALYELCEELNIPICEEVSELHNACTPTQSSKKHDRPCICPIEQAFSSNCECATARRPPIACSIHDVEKLPPPPPPNIAINVYHLLSEKPEVQVLHRADNFRGTSGSEQLDELVGTEKIINDVVEQIREIPKGDRYGDLKDGRRLYSKGTEGKTSGAEEPEWISGVELGCEELEMDIKNDSFVAIKQDNTSCASNVSIGKKTIHSTHNILSEPLIKEVITKNNETDSINDGTKKLQKSSNNKIIIETNKDCSMELTCSSFPSTVAMTKSTSKLSFDDVEVNNEVNEPAIQKIVPINIRQSVDPSGGFDSYPTESPAETLKQNTINSYPTELQTEMLKQNTINDKNKNSIDVDKKEVIIEKCSCESISCDRSNCAPEDQVVEEEYESEVVSCSSIMDIEMIESAPVTEEVQFRPETVAFEDVVEEMLQVEAKIEETEIEVIKKAPSVKMSHYGCENVNGMDNYLDYYDKTIKHPTNVRKLAASHYINSIEPSVRKTEVTVQTSFPQVKEATNKSTNTDIPKQMQMEAPSTSIETDDDYIIIEGPILIPKERVQRSNELLKSTQMSQTYFNTLYKKPCNISFPNFCRSANSTMRPITPYTISPSTDYDMTPQRDILSRNTSCNTMNCLLLGNQYDKHPNLSYFYPNATTQVSSTDLITDKPESPSPNPPAISISPNISEIIKPSIDITLATVKPKQSYPKAHTLKVTKSSNLDNPQHVFITTEGYKTKENPAEIRTYMDNEQQSYKDMINPVLTTKRISNGGKRNASTSMSLHQQRRADTMRMTQQIDMQGSPSGSISEITHPIRESIGSSMPRDIYAAEGSTTGSVDLRIRSLKEDLEKYRIGQMECMPTISRNFPMDPRDRGVSIAHGIDHINLSSIEKRRSTDRSQPSAAESR